MKILEIDRCRYCSHYKNYGLCGHPRFSLGKRMGAKTNGDIPDWCPLEDAPLAAARRLEMKMNSYFKGE